MTAPHLQEDDPVYDQDEIVQLLAQRPGMSWEELQAEMGIVTPPQQRGFMRAMYGSGGRPGLLGPSNRVAVVQFTEWAPHTRTTYRLFPMEFGRLAIPNPNDGADSLYHFLFDPFDRFEKKMAEALRDD